MFKVIVVGTDGSTRAAIAVSQALELAKTGGGTVHVVHVVRTGSVLGAEYADPVAIGAAIEQMHADGERICAQVARDAAAENVTVVAHNLEGDPADVLLNVAKGVDADLVVIGNKGMTGVKRFVLGSVPNTISHHCPCSLLIVNTDAGHS